MVLWNFNENKNYVTLHNYKVLNYNDAEKAAKLLFNIDMLILKSFARLEQGKIRTEEINILLKTPYILQEMQIIKDQGTIKFEGLNKPKNVYKSNQPPVGPDGKLRAKYRRIFLKLRDEKGILKNIENLKQLIAHELTHTAMNHVRWRDDDHDSEFNYYNNKILSSLG
jgi:hypothetical protein